MLISFSLQNFKSFADRAELSLIPKASDKSLRGALISIDAPGIGTEAILASAAIYGANASGKTNFLLGIAFMKRAVQSSHTSWKPDEKIDVDLYAGNDIPAKFEVEIVINKVRYKYGFCVSREKFLEEWLYSYPKGRERLLFVRKSQDSQLDSEIYLEIGNSLSGGKREHESTRRRTRTNSLFLSAAAQDNQPECTEIYQWFSRKLIDLTKVDRTRLTEGLTTMLAHDFSEFRSLIKPLIKMADPSINVIKTRKMEKDDDPSEKEINPENIGKLMSLYSATFNIGNKEENFDIPFDRESKGVKRLYSMSGMLITALAHGHTILVDELETSMHAHVASQILAIFQNPSSNPNGAQIVFTTHETRLLNSQHLRRDQIWFCEKNNTKSELYSLLEFSPRKDENFELGYLSGRYGAIPQVAIDPDWIEKINSNNSYLDQ